MTKSQYEEIQLDLLIEQSHLEHMIGLTNELQKLANEMRIKRYKDVDSIQKRFDDLYLYLRRIRNDESRTQALHPTNRKTHQTQPERDH